MEGRIAIVVGEVEARHGDSIWGIGTLLLPIRDSTDPEFTMGWVFDEVIEKGNVAVVGMGWVVGWLCA